MKNFIVNFFKCPMKTILPSNKIILYLSNLLDCEIIDNNDICDSINYADILFIVNSPFNYCNFKDGLKKIIDNSNFIVWIQNDYNISIPKFIKDKRYILWTSILDNCKNENDKYINWNLLSWQFKIESKEKYLFNIKRQNNILFYYGAYRKRREIYFKKYFTNAIYNINIATSKKSMYKFQLLNNKINFIQPFYNLFDISMYSVALYIEDIFSHKNYCSPASRFYEYLLCNFAIAFDKSTIFTFKKYGIDISNFIVNNQQDLLYFFKNCCDISKNQFCLWNRNYNIELKENVLNIYNDLRSKI